jgi:hypothetical protein
VVEIASSKNKQSTNIAIAFVGDCGFAVFDSYNCNQHANGIETPFRTNREVHISFMNNSVVD